MAVHVHGVFPLPGYGNRKGKHTCECEEWVYRLERGPSHQIGVEFGVSKAARSPRFQPNNNAANFSQQLKAVAEDETAVCVHGLFPLSVGMEREDTLDLE